MSSPVIDPFKLRTYGLKKPLDEKEDKINKLLEENKRYYPTVKNGQVDEWGAVIKHQTEQFQLGQQLAQQQDKFQKKAYQEELQKDVERKKAEQDLQLQLKQRELEIQREYKRQQDEKMQFLKNQEHMTKASVNNLNRRQMSEVHQRSLQVRDLDREMGQKIADEAQREQRQYEDLMRLKKETFTKQFQDDYQEKQRQRQIEQLQKEQEKEEARKMQDYNGQKQMQNQVEFRDRMSKLNEEDRIKQNIYQRSINMSPNMKNYQLSNDNSQDINSFLNQIQSKDVQGQDMRKNYLLQTSETVKNQILMREQQKSFERQNVSMEQLVQKEYATNLNQSMIDSINEKKRRQDQYREMLDNQIKVTNQMISSYGNMTNQEKKLNRADLLAYKSYDNNQYSLIPGIQNKTLQKKTNGYIQNNTSVDSPQKRQLGNLNQTIENVYMAQGSPVINYDKPQSQNNDARSHSRNRSLRQSVGDFRPYEQNNLAGNFSTIMNVNQSIANFDRQMNKERAHALRYAATNILN
ncbi:UNKNOWN [Stylonychia lemnae]|uniref:Uncharacterized protein n=1 Tax=Stylonychia lemnae TaxID=5949 RepID=A0A078AJX4_STYLE|nr:UNKNOWN [Stylonychia lemnae]|eukprot:CDW82191.1 UNKNOWN [Stylonychia lemnae]